MKSHNLFFYYKHRLPITKNLVSILSAGAHDEHADKKVFDMTKCRRSFMATHLKPVMLQHFSQ